LRVSSISLWVLFEELFHDFSQLRDLLTLVLESLSQNEGWHTALEVKFHLISKLSLVRVIWEGL
jgi:hypothetical protein